MGEGLVGIRLEILQGVVQVEENVFDPHAQFAFLILQ
jgi:hypothetical protein